MSSADSLPLPNVDPPANPETVTTRFNRFVTDHPWVAILLFLGVTVWLAAGIPRLRLETDIMAMMPKQHPVFQFNTWVEEYFDIQDPALIGVVNRGPDGVFTPATLALVKHLSDEIKALPMINGEEIISLTEVDNITGDESSLYVDPFYDAAPTTAEGARAIRDAVFASELMVGSLVSADAQATLIIAEMEAGGDYDKVELYQVLQDVVAAAPVSVEDVFIAGRPVIEGEMSVLARTDILRMFPLVVLAAGLMLWLTLRSWRGVVLPLLVVVTSVIWTLGLMGWLRAEFFAIQSMMPTLLIAIGVADGIHVIHRLLLGVAEAPDRPRRDLVFATMQEMTRPVVMTSLTTAAGFASLVVSPMRPIKAFGIYTAFGVLAAMVFSLTILPGLLAILPTPRRAAARVAHGRRGEGGLLPRLLDRLVPLVTRRPGLVLGAGAGVFLFGLTGLPQVVVNGSLLQNFPPTNPVKVADAHIAGHFHGSHPLQIVLDAGEDGGWKDPARLRAVEGLQNHLEAGEHVGQTRSIVDLIKRMNEVMNPEDPDAYRVPDERDVVAQYLFLYTLAGDPDDFEDVVDYDYRQANVRAQIDRDDSVVSGEVLEDVHAYAAAHLAPLGIETRTSGAVQAMHTFMDLIVRGQVTSLALAIVLVAILTGLMCRAAAAGLICIIPVSVASILNFGALAWFGEPLSVTTALISSMGIGIGIDYAIHFVVKYQRTRSAGADAETAMHDTLNTAGVAIFYNALVVFVGFLVLATSAFVPNRVLGILVGLNMVVCFLGTVTAIAAVLHLTQPRFVRPVGEIPADRVG